MTILIIILSVLSSPFTYGEDRCDELTKRHYETLETIEKEDLNLIQEQIEKVLDIAAKGKATKPMLNHFTNNLDQLLPFKRATSFANDLSREICDIAQSAPRNVNDEVDAVRHFVWSAKLSLTIGEQQALMIQSMQEDRDENLTQASIMDLYNNELGLDFARKLIPQLSSIHPRKKEQFIKDQMEQKIQEHLKRKDFHVIKSTDSKCTYK